MDDLAYFNIVDTDGNGHFCNEVDLNSEVLHLQGRIVSIERVYRRVR